MLENNFILILAEDEEKALIQEEATKKKQSLSEFCLNAVLKQIKLKKEGIKS